jgi:hypothetical protein
LPSAWCQTKIPPLRSTTGQAPTRAFGGMRCAYGISTHVPSDAKRQPWKGQRSESPSTLPPRARFAPRCGQYASSTRAGPCSARKMASGWEK